MQEVTCGNVNGHDCHARDGVAPAKALVEWRRSDRGGYKGFLYQVTAGRPVPTRSRRLVMGLYHGRAIEAGSFQLGL